MPQNEYGGRRVRGTLDPGHKGRDDNGMCWPVACPNFDCHRGACPRDPAISECLDRLGTNTGQRGIQVIPMPIGPFDKVDLPGPRPLLDGLFSLDGIAYADELLKPDEPMDLVSRGEARRFARTMLIDASCDAVGNAHVERSSGPACENVNPIAVHRPLHLVRAEYVARWTPGTSPGVTRCAAPESAQ